MSGPALLYHLATLSIVQVNDRACAPFTVRCATNIGHHLGSIYSARGDARTNGIGQIIHLDVDVGQSGFFWCHASAFWGSRAVKSRQSDQRLGSAAVVAGGVLLTRATRSKSTTNRARPTLELADRSARDAAVV